MKQIWSMGDYKSRGQHFPPVSAQLVNLVQLKPKEMVLDVACGYGNTAITACRKGAKVTGIDLTPKLLMLAREEEKIAGLSSINWKEGDVENLPFEDETFDIVLSTFGHIFASNQSLAAKEMVRVLKKGGRLGFSSWPSELLSERLSDVISKYNPFGETKEFKPGSWGSPDKIKRLLPELKELFFERGTIEIPCLSPNHYWNDSTHKAGYLMKIIGELKFQNKYDIIEKVRKEYLDALESYFLDNRLRFGYLLAIGKK
ncbi:MAG: class I SAM-dependent methyltransferase [Candidatus Nitrosocosmicus sp.]